ncbi:hypothetical protein NK356_09375, partial [Chryseobacterium sp. S0630]|uniref:hypothetical protein n=1 Tax=Chryseobacterium sp. S0630 TaxID=2957803 RepID=UPI00209F27D5
LQLFFISFPKFVARCGIRVAGYFCCGLFLLRVLIFVCWNNARAQSFFKVNVFKAQVALLQLFFISFPKFVARCGVLVAGYFCCLLFLLWVLIFVCWNNARAQSFFKVNVVKAQVASLW